MTEAPDFFAARPALVGARVEGAPDLLSEVLRSVHLCGQQILDCAPSPPFAVPFEHPGGTLHIVLRGRLEIEVEGEAARRRFLRGDLVLMPAALPHVVRSSGKGRTRWLAGTFSLDAPQSSTLLSALPAVIELRGLGDQSLLWLDVSSEMLIYEITSPSQGSKAMISRILDLLFIQALRHWATQNDAQPGWLTGAMDPLVGPALTAIHANPQHAWTVEYLARKSNMSRSAFAERFARRVGQSPAAYITRVRLAMAADRLLRNGEAVSAIAKSVGYVSEAAFSRAFSRHYGAPPSSWRRSRQSAGTPLIAPVRGGDGYRVATDANSG